MNPESDVVRKTAIKSLAVLLPFIVVSSLVLTGLQLSKKIDLSNQKTASLVFFAVFAVLTFFIIWLFKSVLDMAKQGRQDAEAKAESAGKRAQVAEARAESAEKRAQDAEARAEIFAQSLLTGCKIGEQLDEIIKCIFAESETLTDESKSIEQADSHKRPDDVDLTSNNDQATARLQDNRSKICEYKQIIEMLKSCKENGDIKLFSGIVSKIQEYFPGSSILGLPIVKVFSKEAFYDAPEPSVDSEQQSKGMRQRSRSLSNLSEVVVSNLLLNRNSGLDK